MTDHHPALPDRIRHKESGVELACQIDTRRNKRFYAFLAPSAGISTAFFYAEWEQVPPPFVFPTRPGAQIKAQGPAAEWFRFTLDPYGNWGSLTGMRVSADDLLDQFGDRLVVTYPGDEPEAGGSES